MEHEGLLCMTLRRALDKPHKSPVHGRLEATHPVCSLQPGAVSLMDRTALVRVARMTVTTGNLNPERDDARVKNTPGRSRTRTRCPE